MDVVDGAKNNDPDKVPLETLPGSSEKPRGDPLDNSALVLG